MEEFELELQPDEGEEITLKHAIETGKEGKKIIYIKCDTKLRVMIKEKMQVKVEDEDNKKVVHRKVLDGVCSQYFQLQDVPTTSR